MKILMISMDFPPNPGGIAVFLHHLADGLARQGHSVTVLTKEVSNEDGPALETAYAMQRYTPSAMLSSLALARRIWQQCRENKPNVIFLGHVVSTLGLGVILLGRLFNIPYVVLSHGSDLGHARVSRIDAWSVKAVLNNAALVMPNSEYTRQEITRQGYHPRHVANLTPGVDATLFHPQYNAALVRNKYGINNKNIMLSVGRLVPIKNHLNVLRALPKVLEKMPDITYLIVGEGETLQEIKEEVQRLKLNSNVIVAGAIPNKSLPLFYCANTLFIMPSRPMQERCESFGIVFAEAGACGKPVIGGRSGGMNDAVIDGVTGLLVDPLDVAEIAGAIIRILTDHAYALQLGENGRKRAVEDLGWEHVVMKLEDYLINVVGSQRVNTANVVN